MAPMPPTDASQPAHAPADAEARSGSEQSVGETLESIRRAIGADRVSVAELDLGAGDFTILGASGERLLPLGERYPLDDSTHFSLAAEGTAFVTPDVDRDPRFVRTVDDVVREHGFRAGASLPLGDGVDGRARAVALHFRTPGGGVLRAARMLEPLRRALVTAVQREPQATIDVVVLDDDPLVGRGILHVLARASGLSARLATGVDGLGQTRPDVVVVTAQGGAVEPPVALARDGGVDAPLVLVADGDSPALRRAALAAGAAGVVPRADVVAALADALRVAADGGTWLAGPVGRPARDLLSPRELDVLVLLDRGLRSAQVGVELGIAHATVKAHTRNVFRKLGATSRAEACYRARSAGLLR